MQIFTTSFLTGPLARCSVSMRKVKNRGCLLLLAGVHPRPLGSLAIPRHPVAVGGKDAPPSPSSPPWPKDTAGLTVSHADSDLLSDLATFHHLQLLEGKLPYGISLKRKDAPPPPSSPSWPKDTASLTVSHADSVLLSVPATFHHLQFLERKLPYGISLK